jgi:diadenylate cyclase
MEVFLSIYKDYIVNILDILIMAFAFYWILLIIRGTRAMQIVIGILALLIFTIITRNVFHLVAVSYLLEKLWVAAAIFLAIAFQTEIRDLLAQVGGKLWRSSSNVKDQNIDFIVSAAKDLSLASSGALIAIENEIGLRSYAENGVFLNAVISEELLLSIFKNKSSPLHDGAVVIYNDKIVAAACVLPLSSNNTISKTYGTRHRAALGLSEATDAVIIAVSEENGAMSIAYKGRLHASMSAIEIKEALITKGKVFER